MANKRRIEVDIIANDKASSVFRNVRTQASGMSSTLMTALNGTANGIGMLHSSLKDYNTYMRNFNRHAINTFKVVGNTIKDFVADSIKSFSELEHQHAKTMGAIATEYDNTNKSQQKFLEDSKKLKQQALTLGTLGPNGKGSLNTVQDVSYAQTTLVKAGLSADDLLTSNVITDILKFAGGNDLDIDTAATFAVNLASVFDKPVNEWGKMLDMVTKAADISVVDVQDIMESLTYTGGIASGLGRDLEEVLGVISVMGQAGLRGRIAGTGLQAFFTRILASDDLSDTQIDKAPTEYVGQMYNAFISDAVNANGTFKSMDEVAELLDEAMSELTDVEQAWFSKKLFGLYQMKAAYALTGSVDGDENLITDFINQIENSSSGSNDIKYELMLASQYGKLTALQNAWEGTKTDFGDRLSPIVKTIGDELYNFLSNNGNYDIDWDNLRDAISESGDLMAEKYGEEFAEFVEGIGNFGLNAGMVIGALAPQAGGILSGIVKLFNGDISGALDEFSEGIDATNENIDGLPEDLRDTANAAKNVITFFTALAGLNIVTKILEVATSIGKPIVTLLQKLFGNITTTKTTVASTSASVNTTSANITATTATVNSTTGYVNIGSVPLMNVTATVVNVYGSGFNNPTTNNPTSPTTPTLPSTPIIPILPSGNGGSLSLPGNTTTTPMLPAGGQAIKMYKVGGTWMTASEALKTVGVTALRSAGILGTLALTLSIPSSGIDQGAEFRGHLEAGIEKGLEGEELRNYVIERQHGPNNIAYNNKMYDTPQELAADLFDATAEAGIYYSSQEGLTEILGKIIEHYESDGEFDEDFFAGLFNYTASNGTTLIGGQKLATEVLNNLFTGTFEAASIFGGSYNDKHMGEFIIEQIESSNWADLSQFFSALSGYETSDNPTGTDVNNVLQSAAGIMDRVAQPNINVTVNTNVDRYGNIETSVGLNNYVRAIDRRAAQYGVVAMDR